MSLQCLRGTLSRSRLKNFAGVGFRPLCIQPSRFVGHVAALVVGADCRALATSTLRDSVLDDTLQWDSIHPVGFLVVVLASSLLLREMLADVWCCQHHEHAVTASWTHFAVQSSSGDMSKLWTQTWNMA